MYVCIVLRGPDATAKYYCIAVFVVVVVDKRTFEKYEPEFS
jgi:hypothetical protein